MGEMDHVQGAKKQTKPNGNQGIITPQQQAVDDLLYE
jgi:hypothetical protein